MQPRRHEDFATQSPVAARLRDRGIDLGPDPYLMPRSRKSLSPRRVEGSQRVSGGDGRSGSLERRDYGFGGGRGDRVRSSSPLFGQMQKRPHYDEGFTSKDLSPEELHRRYEFFERIDRNADIDADMRNEYGYKHNTSRITREEDLNGGRLDSGGHMMLGQKSMVLEDGTGRGIYRLPDDLGSTSKYVGSARNFQSASVNLGLSRFKDERVQYPDPLLLDKLSVMESYGKGEKPMFHPSDASYFTVPASQKDLLGTAQLKDFAGTSSGNSRVNFPGSYRDSMSLPMDEYLRRSIKLTDPLAFSGYGQRRILDTGRDPEAERKDPTRYGRETFSPSRAEHRDYLYPRPAVRESDDYGYPSDDLYRRMALRGRVDYDDRDLLRSSMMDPVRECVDDTEFSRQNLRDGSLWDNPSFEKQILSNYIGLSRSSAASKQAGEYLDSVGTRVEFGRKVPREQETLHLGVSQDREISHMRLDYGFGRDAGPVSHKERMRRSPDFQHASEMHRLAVRTQRMKAEELGTYDPPDRVLKRKYILDEEMYRHNPRSIMPSKWNNSSRPQDLNDRGEEWIGQDARGSLLSKRVGYGHNLQRRSERTFDGADRHRVSASEDWLSSRDRGEHLQDHSIKPYKAGGRYLKGHSRPGSLSWYNSYRSDRRHVLPKPHNVWIRGKDDNLVDGVSEVEESEDWVSSAKSEPPEDSEEFQELVHKFFLSFTKRLNDSPAVRKRYKEQGKAGSLFCIVCGRSLSKEFMDTQRLVTHAYMSHKVGLRAQHLGLHKAICVLLGWNSIVPPDIITWVPEAISSAEAMSQKEDLILWPPVIVIHNSSISDNDTEGQRVITIEALGDFLRGKGFSGGKVKVCLGKPANHGTMVVKFLGTFSGVQDAEKLHRYFAENKHGRTDFEQIASSKGKSSNSREGEMQGDKVDELVLYGYMGIAEDLDKVDYDTKRKCSIKSKKEIQDLADAPVKPK